MEACEFEKNLGGYCTLGTCVWPVATRGQIVGKATKGSEDSQLQWNVDSTAFW